MPKKAKSAYDTALNMLSRRNYAIKEMQQALRKKQISEVGVQDAIARLKEKNFLNDDIFAEGRARYRAQLSGWGKTRILQELREKGVEDTVALKAVSSLADPDDMDTETHDFQSAANSILEKRFKPLSEMFPEKNEFDSEMYQTYQKEIQRRVAFLVRRGFSLDEAKKALQFNDN